ncbi:MAG: hypothetical protein Q9173_004613 [Seirophora scorigena]
MHYTALFVALLFGALSRVFADGAPSSNVSITAAARVGVIREEDIGIVRKFRGRLIPDGPAIHLLSVVMLKLYLKTVEQRGDAKIAQYKIPHKGEHGKLVLEIRSFDRGPNTMSLGSSLYAIHFMLHSTDVILVIGHRGVDVPLGELVLTLQGPIIRAWRDVALNHRVLPVAENTWYSPFSSRMAVILRPRMLGVVPLVTDTDLVEASTGYIYYSLRDQPCGAVNITIVRPDSSGVKTAVGEMEIRGRERRFLSAGSGDDG